MPTFEKINFYLPSSVRHAGPFTHIYESYMPRLSSFLEMALFYKEVGCIGQFQAEPWSEDGVIETLAMQNLGSMADYRGFVMEYCGEERERHMFDVFKLFDEMSASSSSSPDSISYYAHRLEERIVRVEFGYSQVSDFDRAKEHYPESINSVPKSYIDGLSRAVEVLAARYQSSSSLKYSDAVSGAPEATISFSIVAHSDSFLDFEWEISDPSLKDDYQIKSAFEYLVSEILPLQLCEEIGSDPSGVSSTLFSSFDRLNQTDGLSQIIEFHDIVFPDFPSLSEKIFSGDISTAELSKLLDRADRWKKWVGQIDGDSRLIQEYFKEVSSDPFIEKLPSRVVRFSCVTACGIGLDVAGAGGLGTLSAVGIATFDAFFLRQCVDGWRPQKFVEHTLRPALQRRDI